MIIDMLDTESLGLHPDSVVLQIALCKYDLAKNEIVDQFCWWPDLEEQERERRITDHSTILWWMNQSRDAQSAVFSPLATTFKTSLFQQLEKVASNPNGTVWAKPAMFDFPLLASYFNGKRPWSFRAERDAQTILRMYDPTGKLVPDEIGAVAHDARSDALWQARYLARVYSATDGFTKPVTI